MAVLDFAAHTLDYLHVTDGYEDDNGDYVQGSEEWVENYCKCDIVPAGKANVSLSPMVLQRTIPTPSTTFLEHAVISSTETKSV